MPNLICKSSAVASAFTISLQLGRGIRLLLHVVQGSRCQSCLKRKLSALCRGPQKSANIGMIGVFVILYRHEINPNRVFSRGSSGLFLIRCRITTKAQWESLSHQTQVMIISSSLILFFLPPLPLFLQSLLPCDVHTGPRVEVVL